MVICLERGADLHMAQRIPLPLTVSCFSKIQIGFTFLVPAYLGRPGQRAVKRVDVLQVEHNATARGIRMCTITGVYHIIFKCDCVQHYFMLITVSIIQLLTFFIYLSSVVTCLVSLY